MHLASNSLRLLFFMCISSWWQNGCCLAKPHSNIPVSPTNLTEGSRMVRGKRTPTLVGGEGLGGFRKVHQLLGLP